jgi:ribosomal protein S18 acetylase RimI-like enzyme
VRTIAQAVLRLLLQFAPMIALRDATESDCTSIARLHAESWCSAYRGMLSDEYLETRVHAERAALWQARFSERTVNPFIVILAEIDSQLAGFACVFPNEHPVFGSYVDNLHVAPQLARQGIGMCLLAEVGRRLIAHQTPGGVYLWVIAENTNARQFYSRVGAVEVGSEEFPMPDGGRVREVRCYWPSATSLLPANDQLQRGI